MKILLVEDDTALRGALEELLCREGYDVIKASNVSSARSAMNPEVDLVMLDVSLPDGNGVSLCRQWRDEGVQTPILFLTAKDEELDVVRGLDAGGNDYVTKEYSDMDIARLMKIDHKTVEYRKAMAMRKLKALLEGMENGR